VGSCFGRSKGPGDLGLERATAWRPARTRESDPGAELVALMTARIPSARGALNSWEDSDENRRVEPFSKPWRWICRARNSPPTSVRAYHQGTVGMKLPDPAAIVSRGSGIAPPAGALKDNIRIREFVPPRPHRGELSRPLRKPDIFPARKDTADHDFHITALGRTTTCALRAGVISRPACSRRNADFGRSAQSPKLPRLWMISAKIDPKSSVN